MADKIIKSVKFLPEFLQTPKNAKFLASTVDQLIQKPELERLDGYIGRATTSTINDVYIAEPTNYRSNYQIAPSLIVKDIDGNIKDVVGIEDIVNEISTRGGNAEDFDRAFRTSYYSYTPHIDTDKFINYQNYYWLVNGPSIINITDVVNIAAEILGQTSYTIPSLDIDLMNGMKIKFAGLVSPASYQDKVYYVEGVGSSIRLVDETSLLVSEKIASIYDDSFDQSLFDEYPFDSYKRLPLNPDYITINRSSQDLNPWTRYNRWIHKEVIQISSEINGLTPTFAVKLRAQRPIIEFKPDIKLYNFGTNGVAPIDVVDATTTDAFSVVEGSAGYYVDGVPLEQGNRIIFTADTDPDVKNKIYEVNFVTINNQPRLTLVLKSSPATGDTTYVVNGNKFGGTSWWYDGQVWKLAQLHTSLNQPPLFDLFDDNGNSFSDPEVYSSNFKGNQVFGYEIGVGPSDPVLGFPLKYKNSIGVGSYLFKNYFNTDSIALSNGSNDSTIISSAECFLKIGNDYFNSWKTTGEYPVPVVTSVLNTASSYYELPLGITNNPLNGPIESITLSDYRDHVSTSSQTRLISIVNPLPFSLMFIGKREHNLIDATTKAADQYNSFKLAFVKKITELSIENDPVRAIDEALKELSVSKTESSPYYLSDMIAYGDDYNEKTYIVSNININSYPLSSNYDLTTLSLRSILVYLNEELLIVGKDYQFETNDSFVTLFVSLNVGDKIVIRDFQNTRGCYVPSTPSKLGLYPKFQPRIFLDDSYLTPTNVIEGHDGSILVAFNDYRDDIILEFEKRIYNNIKVEYRRDLIDFHSVFPGAFRETGFSIEEVNHILQQDFLRWSTTYGIDSTKNSAYTLDDSYTWNYTGSFIPELQLDAFGSWRALLNYLYDTDRPDLNPWEMLGFTEKPSWWDDEYGAAPYLSTNTKLWNDLKLGRIRQGDREGIDSLYARPGLLGLLPVDSAGVLEDPDEHVINILVSNTRNPWRFGDWGEAETAWRRSSYWPFAVQKVLALCKPANYASFFYDPARLTKNAADQLVYGDSNKFLNLKEMPISGLDDYLTSGYSVYVAEAGRQRSVNYNNELLEDLRNLDINLFYKVGGFVDKSQLQISIDAFDPLSTAPGAVLQPEDYNLILNVSNPIREIAISGIIVEKTEGRYLVKGLDLQNPYFTIYSPNRSMATSTITVGGVSEPFLNWSPSSSLGSTGLNSVDTTSAQSAISGTYYQKGQYVKYNNKFYIVLVNHRSGAVFEADYFKEIPTLPIKGGATVQTAIDFDKLNVLRIPYGTVYNSIQEVYDLIVGYGEYLKNQGFIFDQYNSDLQSTLDWEFSAKEFLFWTTQNWSNNSVIALSPFSDKLSIKLNDSVIDNIFNTFYEYSILEASGLPLPQKNLNVVRSEGLCEIKTNTPYRGIYFARLYSIQKEHAIVFNNRTIFNDTIFNIETGYRQNRMNLLGFRTANWNGDYFSPGFVYDTAVISDWQQFVDYQVEDVVRFNSNYYAAKKKLPGSQAFNFNDWRLLGKKPVAALIPNFDYKIAQFEDFYSLDTNNFDESQQRAAQNLIGYTPRSYLNNVFSDPVSQYKFYQGFIREKGTKNSILKLQRASVQNLNGKIEYNEEWAFRMGYYGAYSSYKEIETALEEGTFSDNPQIIKFVESLSTSSGLKIEIESKDLSIKPLYYKSTQTFVTSSDPAPDLFAITHAGYARFDDVDVTALTEEGLLSFTGTQVIEEGQTVWLANNNLNDWSVLRKKLTIPKLIRVQQDEANTNQFLFTTDRPHGFSERQILTIEEFDESINGTYRVFSILDRDTFIIQSTTFAISEPIEKENPGLIFVFENARYNTFDDLPSDIELLSLPRNAKVWIDNDENNEWKVYQKIKNYKNFNVTASESPSNQSLGFNISKQKSSSIYMVGNPGFVQADFNYGNVYVYETEENYSRLLFRYGINDETDKTYYDKNLASGFGNSLFYDSKDFIDENGATGYGLLFAGAPLASKVHIPAVSTITSTLIEQGLVKVTSVDPEIINSKTVMVLGSPAPASNERFGSSLFVANKNENRILLVGAPGTPTAGTGTVYRYVITTSTINTGTIDIVSTSSISLNFATVDRVDLINKGTQYKVGDILNLTTSTTAGISTTISVKVSKVDSNGGILSFAKPYDNSIVYPNVIPGTTLTNIIVTVSTLTNTTGENATVSITLRNETGSQWGYAISGSEKDSFARDTAVFAIGAPGFSLGKGLVAIYTGTSTVVSQYLVSPFPNNSNFGSSIAVSPSGSYIFVGAVNARSSDQSYGKVAVYYRESSTQTFILTQVISNPVPGVGMKFGQSLDINTGDEELIVSAIGTYRRLNLTFDDRSEPWTITPEKYDNDPNSDFSVNDTSYDINSTYFVDRVVGSGSVYIYNRKNNLFKAADSIPPVNISTGTNFGYSVAIQGSNIFVGAPAGPSTTSALHHFYKIDKNADSWKLLRYQEPLVTDSVQKVSLIDTLNDEVVDYLEVFDPIKGKIIGIAEQELSYKLSYDPAIYSVGNSNVVVDLNTNWTDNHVGELWWDLSSVKYPWYEQGEEEYRKNYWGRPFPGSSIDVYEWVETQLLPSQWFTLANTREGLDQGISGEPKYLDNTNLSVRQVYNKISGTFSNYYYYWVKNTVIVPAAKNRRISAFQVARLIEDPKLQGQRFVEILSSNSLAIANSSNLLIDNRIHLNVSSDEINNTLPKHTEWLLLQEGLAYSQPPAILEKKLLDSLKGSDSLGNPVPDPNLSSRERYGISIRPRQTMFKDRISALRNVIEYANGVLLDERINGIYSFENLNKQESPPDITSNEYDQVVEDNLDLELVNTNGLETAELTCSVSNGVIVGVQITNPGYGYKVAPTVSIDNSNGARITTVIDALGRVIDTVIVSQGKMFVDPPRLTVRPYSVLVLADATYNGKWAKFIYNNSEYTIWKSNVSYAYGQKVKYNNTYFAARNDVQGKAQFDISDWEIIPLSQVDGEWVRVRTQVYNTPLYWNYTDWISKDYNRYKNAEITINSIFELDAVLVDEGQYIKIRDNGLGNYIILEKVGDDSGNFTVGYDIVYEEKGTIQISDDIWNYSASILGFDKSTYDQTLYSQSPDVELKYILDALKNDIFIGPLKVYWNLLFFKSVRYAMAEQKLLDWAFKTSFINVTNYAGELKQLSVYKLADTNYYEEYLKEAKPYHTQIRSFTTNHSLSEVSNSYTTDFDLPPVFDPDQGKIITVNSGSEYLSRYPWKSWADNYGSTDTVRINQITLRYDRINRTQVIDDLNCTDSFIANGIRTEFPLSWLAEPDSALIDVLLENNKVLESDYQIVYYKEEYNGYLKKFSKILFKEFIPALGQKITVNYRKNTELLTAVDRTLSFYSPTNEMPGVDLAQLMTGIEYPQTSLEGLSINYSTQWGDSFVGFDNTPYEDALSFYTFTTSTNSSTTVSGTLTQIVLHSITGVEVGQTINVISSTSSYFAASIADEPKVYSVNTSTKTIRVNKPTLSTIPAGSKLEFWAYNENPAALDTQIIGGDFSYAISTESGAVIVDGDGFITPNTSYAPEELVPGEVYESIGINVYTKAPVQVPVIVASSLDILQPYTITTRELTVVPPSPAAIIVSYSHSVITATNIAVVESLTTTIYLSTLTSINVGDQMYNMVGLQSNTVVRGFTGTNGIIISKPITTQLSTGTIFQFIKVNQPTIFEYKEWESSGTNFTSSDQFTIDWSNDNGKHPLLVIPGQAIPGKLSYQLITIGGSSTEGQTGFIDTKSVVVEDTNFAEVESLSIIGTVKSAYVTVNGVSIPSYSVGTATYYTLTSANIDNQRAAVKVYNLITGTNVVSAWFFGTEQKYWNEIREEIKIVPKFTKTFTGVATLGSPVITNCSTVSEITTGSTQIYARNPDGGFYLSTPRLVINKVGTTITLNNNVTQLPPGFTTTATMEFSILVNGYTEFYGVPGLWDSTFEYPPGNIKPEVANTIIEFKKSNTSIRRMMIPPQINYYSVENVNYNSFAVVNKTSGGTDNILVINELRVYLNGNELRRGFDFIFNDDANVVKIDTNLLRVGDVVAILSKPGSDNGGGQQDYEYDIYDDNLILCSSPVSQLQPLNNTAYNQQFAGWNPDSSGEIKIITYNNHDNLLMRTEVFDGNPSGRFKISRPVLDENYIWVSINGIPLANFVDFDLLDDGMTVQITDAYSLVPRDVVTIISFADNKTTADILGFRIFNDLFNRYHYKRLSKLNSTELTQPLTELDSEIHVKNANVLTKPIVSKNIPGVILINGERIEFFTINGNVLGQLRRGTLGTSPKVYSQVGTSVIDQGTAQSIPYGDKILKQSTLTEASVNTYIISTSSFNYYYNTNTVSTGTWINDGIILSAPTTSDQVEIYYGGRKLNKNYTYHQDPTVSFDSQEIRRVNGLLDIKTTATVAGLPAATEKIGTAYIVTTTNQVWVYENSLEENAISGYVYKGLMRKDPEFTLNTATQAITLNIEGGVKQGIRLTVVKKEFDIETLWNNDGVSLLDSNSNPAKFLRARPAELPDDQYYGGDFELTENSGAALTDDEGNPLTGIN